MSFSENAIARTLDDRREGRRSLLIVDDDEGPRAALSVLFRERYEVLTACDGAAAIRLARESRIDAAIVDIRMPGLSGIETLAELKKLDPQMEVVILTAYETLETARRALRLGACDYLSKPFELEPMRACIAAAMERRRAADGIVDGSRELELLRRSIRDFRMSEQLARTKGEIFASVIHDINGPMTVISGFVDIVNDNLRRAQRLEGAGLESLKAHLAKITRQVDACINISRRYLGFFREANESEATVRVNQVLKDLAELLRVHPAAKSNRLSLQALEADCGVAVNGTDLIQCLLNLAINALQSSERPHAVEIVARRHERPVDFELMAQAPRVRVINPVGSANQPPLVSISVMDDGDGICDGVAARLFEGYVTTKPEGEGTGLGLAIVGRIVRDCGGSIVLETAPGAGASFTLYLPALP